MDSDLAEAYHFVPMPYHWLLELMEKNKLQDQNEVKSADQKNRMEYGRLLIKWMQTNFVCEPFWIKIMYHMIKTYKLTILREFREVFKSIMINYMKKWTTRALEVVKLLESIKKQMGEENLYQQLGFMEIPQLLRASIPYMPQATRIARPLVEINDVEYKMYKFLLKAGGWARDCKKSMIQIQNGVRNKIAMSYHVNKYQEIKEEEQQISNKLMPRMTCFETAYYKDTIGLFKRFEIQFKVMYQIKDNQEIKQYVMDQPPLNSFGIGKTFSNTIQSLKESYEFGKLMALKYKKIPKKFQYICELLQSSNAKYVLCKPKTDPKETMLDTADLCGWLSQNILAKKTWIRVVERLVSFFKLSVLCFLKEGFRRIYESEKKLKLFKKRGTRLMSMIWKIVLQIHGSKWNVSFNLNYEWKICKQMNIDGFDLQKLDEDVKGFNLRLTDSELTVYVFISKVCKWSANLREVLDYKIDMKSYKKSGIDLQVWMKDVEELEAERKRIEKKYCPDFNLFEIRFYRSATTTYITTRDELKDLAEKVEKKKFKKALKERETREPEFSDDSDVEKKPSSSRNQKNSRRSYEDSESSSRSRSRNSYRTPSKKHNKSAKKNQNRSPSRSSSPFKSKGKDVRANESEAESNVSEESSDSLSRPAEEVSKLKREWESRIEQSEKDSEEEGEMSLDEVYCVPPTEDEVEHRRKRLAYMAVKKQEPIVKSEYVQKIRNSIRERLQEKQQAKLENVKIEAVEEKPGENERPIEKERETEQQTKFQKKPREEENDSSEQEGQVQYKGRSGREKGQKRTRSQDRSESPVRRKIYDLIILQD